MLLLVTVAPAGMKLTVGVWSNSMYFEVV